MNGVRWDKIGRQANKAAYVNKIRRTSAQQYQVLLIALNVELIEEANGAVGCGGYREGGGGALI